MIVDKIKKREDNSLVKRENKVDIPADKWIKCDKCKEIIYKDVLKDNYGICPYCNHYFRISITL